MYLELVLSNSASGVSPVDFNQFKPVINENHHRFEVYCVGFIVDETTRTKVANSDLRAGFQQGINNNKIPNDGQWFVSQTTDPLRFGVHHNTYTFWAMTYFNGQWLAAKKQIVLEGASVGAQSRTPLILQADANVVYIKGRVGDVIKVYRAEQYHSPAGPGLGGNSTLTSFSAFSRNYSLYSNGVQQIWEPVYTSNPISSITPGQLVLIDPSILNVPYNGGWVASATAPGRSESFMMNVFHTNGLTSNIRQIYLEYTIDNTVGGYQTLASGVKQRKYTAVAKYQYINGVNGFANVPLNGGVSPIHVSQTNSGSVGDNNSYFPITTPFWLNEGLNTIYIKDTETPSNRNAEPFVFWTDWVEVPVTEAPGGGGGTGGGGTSEVYYNNYTTLAQAVSEKNNANFVDEDVYCTGTYNVNDKCYINNTIGGTTGCNLVADKIRYTSEFGKAYQTVNGIITAILVG